MTLQVGDVRRFMSDVVFLAFSGLLVTVTRTLGDTGFVEARYGEEDFLIARESELHDPNDPNLVPQREAKS